jgi:hypothetical protein
MAILGRLETLTGWTAGFGQKRPFAVGSGKVRFQIKKRSLGQHAFGLNPLEVDS